MEFYDEDRPRFVFRSRPSSSRTAEENDPKPPNKIFISVSVAISLLVLSLSFFYFESEPTKSLLLRLSISALIGPFAPSSLTGGRIRVGYGQILEQEQINEDLSIDNERESRRNKRSNKMERISFKFERNNTKGIYYNGFGEREKGGILA
ncbi:unnamed protein product [Brassica rapa subsp. narinosa]